MTTRAAHRSWSTYRRTLTGLDWDGTAPNRRMLYWLSPPAMAPMTFFFKVFQRNQVSSRADGSRYYTTFFWGNNGDFVWGANYDRSYIGTHPYPSPPSGGDGKWEISTAAHDYRRRDNDGSGTPDEGTATPYVTNNRWYNQATICSLPGGGIYRTQAYLDLPSVSLADRITVDGGGLPVTPTTPAIVVGQAPDNGAGASWGGYSGWEEQNAIIRGIQFYAAALTESQVTQLAALDYDSDVLAKCITLGISAPWYLNMNPTPTDVTDKSGNAHHGTWAGSSRPSLWTG